MNLDLPQEDRLDAPQKINIVQGEYQVSGDPRVVFTTILGSCVAACIHDPVARVGGLNHFLLPGESESEGLRYGAYAMELLVNGLLQRGARRERMQAKLFGGACVQAGLTNIGELNAVFAETFLEREGIAVTGKSLRGVQARRLQYWPVAGRARQLLAPPTDMSVFRQEKPAPKPHAHTTAGEVELF
jgi:chemotaxis protein CheD